MEKEFTGHLVYVNRKESFWFYCIRSVNYFCYKYWWFVLLLFFTIVLLWFLFCLKPFQNRNTTWTEINNFNEQLNAINNTINSCCDCNSKIESTPYIPRENCRVHFSGGIMSGIQEEGITQIYTEDDLSEYVGAGEYPDNTIAFPKAVGSTFDGIAIDKETTLIIYSEKNFKGDILLNASGPLVINNVKWINDPRYSNANTDTYPSILQNNYPQEVRKWSSTDMHSWSNGSCKIFCKNGN